MSFFVKFASQTDNHIKNIENEPEIYCHWSDGVCGRHIVCGNVFDLYSGVAPFGRCSCNQ